jgi:hypothetical protein
LAQPIACLVEKRHCLIQGILGSFRAPPIGAERSDIEKHACLDLRITDGIGQLKGFSEALLGGLNPAKGRLDSGKHLQHRRLAVSIFNRDKSAPGLEQYLGCPVGFAAPGRDFATGPEGYSHASLVTGFLGDLAAALEQNFRIVGAALVCRNLPQQEDAVGMATVVVKVLAKTGRFHQGRRRNTVVAHEHSSLAQGP